MQAHASDGLNAVTETGDASIPRYNMEFGPHGQQLESAHTNLMVGEHLQLGNSMSICFVPPHTAYAPSSRQAASAIYGMSLTKHE